MKKLIAKILNAVRNRRRLKKSTTEIEVGGVYLVEHTMRRRFYIQVKKFNLAWVVGFVMDAETREPGEEMILLRELCTFTKLGDKK